MPAKTVSGQRRFAPASTALRKAAAGFQATLLGQDIAFTPEGDRGAVRGFAGADFVFVTDGRLQLQGTIEAGYGSDRAFTAVARAGLNIPF